MLRATRPKPGKAVLRTTYNCRFAVAGYLMEAERINAVAGHIADLKSREMELRRYL